MNKSLGTQTDEALMVRVNDQDHEAFTVLVKRHSTRFYQLAYRMLFNQADAEDIVQEAFLKLWTAPACWQPARNAKFTTWFYRIVVNACYDKNKKRQLPLTPLYEIGMDVEAPIKEVLSGHESQGTRTESAMKTLPARQRAAINLCFFDELSNQEAADVMGVSIKALQSLIMRGKATLKSILISPR